jgi:hypothetical protein
MLFMGVFRDKVDLKVIQRGREFRFIQPSLIKYGCDRDFSIHGANEYSCLGDWDREIYSFMENSLIYKAYCDVYREHRPWSETRYYKEVLPFVNILDVATRDYFISQRCSYLDYLFRCIRDCGYHQNPLGDSIDVSFGRNGEIILNNGRHRLAAMLACDYSNLVPVTITVRHGEWVAFKQRVIDYAQLHENMLYQPVKHPEFQFFKIRQKVRFPVISSEVSQDLRKIVDLGTQWGFMCQLFADEGREPVGVELDPVEFWFLNKFRAIGNYHFKIYNVDIYDYVKSYPNADCFLALSIFHHFMRTKEGYFKLVRILQRMNSKQLIFQMCDRKEFSGMRPYLNFTDKEFVNFIIAHSCYSHAKEIGGFERRKMFSFVRS